MKVKSVLKKTKNGLMTFTLKVLRKQKNGISQKKVKNGTPNTEKDRGLIGNIKHLLVKSVEKNIKQGIVGYQNTAITTARLKQIAEKEKGEQVVYDLMVDECHEYFANGILVHNCIDASRYNITFHLDNPHSGKYHVL